MSAHTAHVAEAVPTPKRLSEETLMEPGSAAPSSETSLEPLIQLAARSHATQPAETTLPYNLPSTSPSATTVPEGPIPQELGSSEDSGFREPPRHSTMAESVYSYYSDSDAEDYGYLDALSDNESIYEGQCQQAQAVRFLQPGRPSIVDLMRAERPMFKRASQMTVRRPIERPFISPIQPPKRYRRSFSPPGDSSGSESSSSSYGKRNRSSQSSVPTTPILDEDGSSTPTSEGSPSTPETPKSSFDEEEHRFEYTKDNASAAFKSRVKMPSRFRMFPKRSTSMNVQSDTEIYKTAPQLPPLNTETVNKTTGSLFTISTHRNAPRGADERETSVHLSHSPEDEPMLSKHTPPQRSMWSNAGRSKFLGNKIRRVESRVGLNAH